MGNPRAGHGSLGTRLRPVLPVPTMPCTIKPDVRFTSESPFTARELRGLWALCGVEVMHVYHFMDAILKIIDEPCPTGPDTRYWDMDMP